MKLTANGNEYNAIRNAIDKEVKIAASNMQLMNKLDYLVAARITKDTIERIETLIEQDDSLSQIDKDRTVIATFTNNLLKDKYGDNILDSEIDKLIKNAMMLPTEYITENAYINNIKFKGNETFGNYTFLNDKYEKYQFTEYAGHERKNLLFYPCWGLFRCSALSYVLVDKNNNGVAVTIPSEMLQTQKYIDNAKGNVLVLGVKVGYFSYLAGLKDDVSQITIVEKDEDVLGFFNQYIFPQFDEKIKAKIKIMKYDPIEYFKFLPDGQFDYCFVDLWGKHSVAQDYYKLLPYHNKFKSMKVEYYKELRIIENLYETVGINIYFALQKRNNQIPKDASFVEHFKNNIDYDQLVIVDRVFADYKIKNVKDLMNLFSFQFLLEKFNSIPYVEEF